MGCQRKDSLPLGVGHGHLGSLASCGCSTGTSGSSDRAISGSPVFSEHTWGKNRMEVSHKPQRRERRFRVAQNTREVRDCLVSQSIPKWCGYVSSFSSNSSRTGARVTMYCCACGSPGARRKRGEKSESSAGGFKLMLHYPNENSRVIIYSSGEHEHDWKHNSGVPPPFDKIVEEQVTNGVTTWDEMERIIDDYITQNGLQAEEKPPKKKVSISLRTDNFSVITVL